MIDPDDDHIEAEAVYDMVHVGVGYYRCFYIISERPRVERKVFRFKMAVNEAELKAIHPDDFLPLGII
jgi:hypothetical protein